MTEPCKNRPDENGPPDLASPAAEVSVYLEELEQHYSQTPLVKELAAVAFEAADDEQALSLLVVPDFEYLKSSNISIAKEAIRYSLDDLGRELPAERRVRRYIVWPDRLPRADGESLDRPQLRRIVVDMHAGRMRNLEPSPADRELIDSGPGRAVAAVVRQCGLDRDRMHPDLNLEIDLGLDSLARAEALAALETRLGIALPLDECARAFTLRELIAVCDRSPRTRASVGFANPAKTGSRSTWSRVFSTASEPTRELETILDDRPLFMLFVFSVYKVFNLICRLFLRLEVSGVERLLQLRRPFIVCPNHQSFLDPFVVCSTYSFEFFRNSFHLGASYLFQGRIMSYIGRMLHIVPVDADTRLTQAMKAAATGLKHGKILNIYPEGERAYDGELHEFKNGAAVFAVELGVPIVPVAIDGLQNVWPRRSMRIRPAKVKVRFGEPINALDILAVEQGGSAAIHSGYDLVTARVRDAIGAMIEEMRK